jgi:hypothetical protein
MAIIINLFGASLRYWVCELPQEKFHALEKSRTNQQEDWTNLFFDLDWLAQFGFAHWSDFAIMEEQNGMLCLPKCSIEIKKGRKMLEKFSADKLIHSASLFELHRTRAQKLTVAPHEGHIRFILIQTEIGLVGKFKVDQESILIDELEFVLTDLAYLNAPRLLTSILHRGEKLIKTDEDTVVSGYRVVFMADSHDS